MLHNLKSSPSCGDNVALDICFLIAVDRLLTRGHLQEDALDNSHPVEVPGGHPQEVHEIFDSISYDKGASVIRMLYNYIGDEVRVRRYRMAL